MKQTAIYTADGHIIMLLSDTGLGEIASLEADIPDGYRLDSINPETKEPVLAEIPKTAEQQRLDELAAQISALKKSSEAKDDALSKQQDFQEDCIAEMAGVVYADDSETA